MEHILHQVKSRAWTSAAALWHAPHVDHESPGAACNASYDDDLAGFTKYKRVDILGIVFFGE
jgi:hypothetical protein